MTPLVSILIPAFNASEYIATTLRSALAQNWPRKEIIVVDDGSTDATLAIARSFRSREVSVVTQPNQGAAAARNTALSLSQGDVIQWLDADDLLAPDKIAQQMEASLTTDDDRILFSSPWGSFFHRPSRTRFVGSPLWCTLSPVDWLVRKLQHNAYMQTATWLVSRRLTNASGAWDTRLTNDDDGEYFARVVAASAAVWFVPAARVLYRISGVRQLSYIGLSDHKLESLALSMRLQIRYLRNMEDSDRVRTACRRLLQRNAIHFYPQRPDLVAELGQLAADLGGPLDVPQLPARYDWIRKVFGWRTAKRISIVGPEIRWSIVRCWDKALARLERPDIPAEIFSPRMASACPSRADRRMSAGPSDPNPQSQTSRPSPVHVSICICTFRRPALLTRLLQALATQENDGAFTYSLVVVDNDAARSSEAVVADFSRSSRLAVQYCVEPRQSIALARNKAVANATGDCIAFIDDDECPPPRWMATLVRALRSFGVDGVLGPVRPEFEASPPRWVVAGKFYERPSHPTGSVIGWRQGRTGNTLLKRSLFEGDRAPFNPEFLTGEDQDLFRRMIQRGHTFVWCEEAAVHEVVPPMRWRRGFMMRRALLRGSISPRHPTFGARDVVTSLVAIPVYAAILPLALVLGQATFMTYVVKLCDHLGRLLALVHIHPVKESYVTD
jgi:succinoglycan biosynthesis protein ExoM